ncbi:hypothetical protein [Amycolatopsis suaedae]|uniref:DUF485 domain-containing protein n=1 Tax=Amycolatopsis suaedae TaxID=2510978 RepID=A0A4Q7J711_9PSEU|nr:hypothetical protein [Amycolatopsis suaedae]RZQ62123.1 hypothetical protein EWH70_21320 [Amycolatopsis suaedae]
MTQDDYFRKIGGVREPDPTLGKNLRQRRSPHQPAEVETVSSGPRPEPEQHLRPRRQRVVLSGPKQPSSVLRARVELEEQTSWGELLIKDLVKAQLRSAVLLALLVLVILGSLPAAFYLSPQFAAVNVLGVPLPWLLLGVLPFPLLLGVGIWYNRLAERHERAFVAMIEN